MPGKAPRLTFALWTTSLLMPALLWSTGQARMLQTGVQPFGALTFEDQTLGGFTPRGGTETLTVSSEANHTAGGSQALKVQGRSISWHGPSLRIEKFVENGGEYRISVWVKLLSPAGAVLQLSTQVGEGNAANYVQLAQKNVQAEDGWVELTGTYRYTNTSSGFLSLYVESPSPTAAFFVDDVQLQNTGAPPIQLQQDLTSLQEVYRPDFLIGSAITSEDLAGVRLELLKKHHNIATAANAMKPDGLQPSRGNFTFDLADQLVNRVLAEGLQVHGHVLVWHQQSPDWLNTTLDAQNNRVPLGREEALQNLRTHIQTVMEHFGPRVISWDVVNEAMNDNLPADPDWQGSLRRTPWYQAIGPDYVEQAFLAAREVLDRHPDWNIKLYYNDYNEDQQPKAQAIFKMVKDLNDRYAQTHPGKKLIDGIGMQGHYNINTNPDNVRLSLERFLSLGVEVSVTELDIQAGSNGELTDQQATAQGYLYAQLMQIFKAHQDGISRVTFWGMDDGTSWRASSNPLLFDRNLQAKPAFQGVVQPEAFMAANPPKTKQARQGNAVFGTPVVDGNVDDIWNTAPALPIERYQMAWQGAHGVARALWDTENLYVLFEVTDTQLDKKNPNAWEQDSIEVFLDENNLKTSFYQPDDGQYRVNFDNATSFTNEAISRGFASVTRVSGTNYTVEVKIPWKTLKPAQGQQVGFDVQINDGHNGARQSVATWNDLAGTGYMDTSVFGVLTLTGGPAAK